jgi:O-antigen biosynthesis protein
VGLEHARGPLIAYLDSDNTWNPDFLTVMVGELTQNDADFGYCAQRLWPGVEPGEALAGFRFAPFNRSLLENDNHIDINVVVHARWLVEEHGGFDEDIVVLEDWDLALRYTSVGTVRAVPCLLSDYFTQTSENQMTRSVDVARPLALVRERSIGETQRHGFRGIGALTLDCIEVVPARDHVAEVHDELDRRFDLVELPSRIRRRSRTHGPVRVVLPDQDALPRLTLTLGSLLRTLGDGDEILVIDRGSRPDVTGYLANVAEQHPSVRHRRDDAGCGHTTKAGTEAMASRCTRQKSTCRTHHRCTRPTSPCPCTGQHRPTRS